MSPTPLPDLILYARTGCHLCDEARELVSALLDDRAAHGLPVPALVERDIDTDPDWQRAYFLTIPVLELGERRLELATSLAKIRRLLSDVLDAEALPAPAMSNGTDLTLLVALLAGVISFLSPCVLPLVPAYLGQLTAIAVAGSAPGAQPSRWLAVRHSIAYVAGFGAVFTLLGVTATFAAGPLYDYLAPLRIIGGVLLVILGLNLAGLIHIPVLERTWRPLDAGAAGSLATATGSVALASPGGSSGSPSMADRMGGRMVDPRGGWLASFGLGAIFAIGWSPCIGIILGGILTMAISSETAAAGTALLIAYSIGLGLPFIAIAVVYDRAPRLIRPLVRHGRVVSLIGGLLVAAIGVAMIFDWLSYLPRFFNFGGV